MKDDFIVRLLNGDENQLNQVKEKLISYKINSFGFTGLIHSKDFDPFSDIKATTPSLEAIMIYFSRKDMYNLVMKDLKL
ncbi:hypothetical protein M3215_17735 [Bacillus cytotoxicus]|uniref:Uncharacterized protein n=1 Tax=Bacillus cytotoxicus TaxID=580165 RepID=A0ACC6AAS7_9BACI|nr:hypothetical protein [Bacillus cytotoxicus]